MILFLVICVADTKRLPVIFRIGDKPILGTDPKNAKGSQSKMTQLIILGVAGTVICSAQFYFWHVSKKWAD